MPPTCATCSLPRGVFVPDMRISQLDGVDTSHAEGTLNLLTGRYLAYRDAGSGFLQDRLEPTEPTLFEYLRESFDIPSHEALLINGEDRPQEEFFTYGVSEHYGIAYRSEMLSLHRFKLYKFARILEEGTADEATLQDAQEQYDALLAADPRAITPGTVAGGDGVLGPLARSLRRRRSAKPARRPAADCPGGAGAARAEAHG
jgi:hypothetical protein